MRSHVFTDELIFRDLAPAGESPQLNASRFDATELERMSRPDGTIGHAEVRIGDSVVMMGEARGESTPMPGTLYVYVSDTDAVYKRALEAGAASLMEPADQFYGDRNAAVKDAVGNRWWIATHKEDVSPQEIVRR